MFKKIVAISFIFILGSYVVANYADLEINKTESSPSPLMSQTNNEKEEIKYTSIPIVDLRELKPIPSRIEIGLDWCMNNLNNLHGWSLTGYAHTSLDAQFRMQRWKFGIISAEMADPELDRFHELHGIHNKRQKSLLFGIAFNKEF
jgi:hypothetical protein